jgi:hypothetical protein
MNDQELKSLWKNQPLDPHTVSLETIRNAAHDFHQTIVRRNRYETWACYLVMLVFGGFAFVHASLALRAGCVMVVLGTIVILVQLRKRAAIRALPGANAAHSYVTYLRTELIHQRDALRTIWLWYVAPCVPGLGLLIWGMAENDPSGFPWIAMLALFVVPFGVVIWMNLVAARAMQKKISELDASAR